jgi:Delta14-sterol reductase
MSAGGVALAALAVIGFVSALFVASRVVPGPVHTGLAGPETGRRYTLNGLRLFLLTAVVVATLAGLGLWSPAVIVDRFAELLVAANVLAVGAAGVLYAVGRRAQGRGMLDGGLRPAAREYIYGVERNPVWAGVDLKMFSYRPSLIGLALVNVAFAFAQWERHGRLAGPLILFEVFTLLYIGNYFHFEHGMLSTWDVLEERFGWALVWGDYVLVPFFYSLPGWYLVDRLTPLSMPAVAGLIAMYALGFWLFRGANQQKHRFKLDPTALIWRRPPETIGGRLLVSGFWGVGRKLNYTGELLLYYAWTLPCGLASPVPYLPALWLTLRDFRWSWAMARATVRFPSFLDGCAALMRRRGSDFLVEWGEAMTGARPKRAFMRPRVVVPIMGETVCQWWRGPAAMATAAERV